MMTKKNTLNHAASAAILAMFVFLAAACVPNFNALPMAADVSQHIKQAMAGARQIDGAKAKAMIFAKAYCELRAKYPDAIERIRTQLQAAVPPIAVAATKALIDKGCGKLIEDNSKQSPGSAS